MSEHISEFCREKFNQYDKHCSEGVSVRDMVIKHENDVERLNRVYRENTQIKWSLLLGLPGIIITIFLSSAANQQKYGQMIERVDWLYRIHQSKATHDVTFNKLKELNADKDIG